jgi:hypothetical protein
MTYMSRFSRVCLEKSVTNEQLALSLTEGATYTLECNGNGECVDWLDCG